MNSRFFLRVFVMGLAGLLVLASAAPTQAQDAQRSGRKFFVRGAIGPGYVKMENDRENVGLALDHIGGYWDLAVGITAYKNLAVHATYFGGFAYNPDVKQDGKPVNGSANTSLSILGAGPGLTYHFYPINVYLSYSAGVGFSVLRFHDNNQVGASLGWSNFGFANEVVIGKEWWVGGGLAIGFGVQALYARVLDDQGSGPDVKYNSFGGAALFSSTYH